MLLKREFRELFRESRDCRGGGGLIAANYLWGFCTGRFEKPVQQEGIGNLGLRPRHNKNGLRQSVLHARPGIRLVPRLMMHFQARSGMQVHVVSVESLTAQNPALTTNNEKRTADHEQRRTKNEERISHMPLSLPVSLLHNI